MSVQHSCILGQHPMPVGLVDFITFRMISLSGTNELMGKKNKKRRDGKRRDSSGRKTLTRKERSQTFKVVES